MGSSFPFQIAVSKRHTDKSKASIRHLTAQVEARSDSNSGYAHSPRAPLPFNCVLESRLVTPEVSMQTDAPPPLRQRTDLPEGLTTRIEQRCGSAPIALFAAML